MKRDVKQLILVSHRPVNLEWMDHVVKIIAQFLVLLDLSFVQE